MKEQFEARNILHSVASLWNYRRTFGGQGAIKKADICRALEGDDRNEPDSVIIDRFKGKGVNEIQFLSHSYFGENDNLIHFQHQSFAEILLAEYYLKVFLKFALDEGENTEEARTKLQIGEPTDQTMYFLRELLVLVRQTIKTGQEADITVIEKRQLLAPLIASLSTNKFNKHLFSSYFKYNWFGKLDSKMETNSTKLPDNLLYDWPIDEECLNKINALCKDIIEAKSNYFLMGGVFRTSLFKDETFVTQTKFEDVAPDIDKWIALLVGNVFMNDIENRKFFNSVFSSYAGHFVLIKNWNYYASRSSPIWATDLFCGLHFEINDSRMTCSRYNFSQLDFSYSYFRNCNFLHSNFYNCKFHFTTFDNVDLGLTNLGHTSFKEITIVNFGLRLELSQIDQGLLMPYEMCSVFSTKKSRNLYTNYGTKISVVNSAFVHRDIGYSLYETVGEFMIYGITKGAFTIDEAKSFLIFEGEQEVFYSLLEKDLELRKVKVESSIQSNRNNRHKGAMSKRNKK